MLSLEHGGCIHSSDVELRSDRTALVSNKSGNFRQKDGEKLSGDKKTERMTTMGDSIPQLTAKKKKKLDSQVSAPASVGGDNTDSEQAGHHSSTRLSPTRNLSQNPA